MPLIDDPNAPPAEKEESGSLWSAIPGAIGTGLVKDIVAPAYELGATISGDDNGMAARMADVSRGIGAALEQTIPEDRRKQMNSVFVPNREAGETGVMDAPFGTAVMKGLRIAPTIGGAMLAGPSVVPQTLLGGAQNLGSYLSETKGQVDEMSDEQLAAKYPTFAESIQLGLPAGEARKLLKDDLITGKGTLLATAGGAMAGGALGHVLGGAGAKTATGMLGRGVAETGIGVGAMGAATKLATEVSEVDSGNKPRVDWKEIGRAGLNAGLEGAVLGGGFATIPAGRAALDRIPPRTAKTGTGRPTVEPDPTTGLAPDIVLAASPDPVTPAGKSTVEPPGSLDERIAQVEARMAAENPITVAPEPTPGNLPQDAHIRPPEALPPEVRTEVAPQPETPVRAEANQVSDLAEGVGSMGSGMVDGLYASLFKALQAGNNTVAGVRDPVLQKAKPAYEAGLIKSPEDLRVFVNNGYQMPGEGMHPIAEVPDVIIQPEVMPAPVPDALTEAIHGLTTKNTKMSALIGKIPGVDAAGLLTKLREMRKSGELVYNEKRGYRSSRTPEAPRAVEPQPAPEPVAAPAAPSYAKNGKLIGKNFKGEDVWERPDGRRIVVRQDGMQVIESNMFKNADGRPYERPDNFWTLGEDRTKSTPFSEPVTPAGNEPSKPKTTLRLAKKVENVLEEQAKARAESEAATAAQRAADRAAGKSVVLRAKAATVDEAAARAAAEAKVLADHRAADAARKVTERQKAGLDNDAKAKQVLEEQWAGTETAVADQAAFARLAAKDVATQVSAIKHLLMRARRMYSAAEEAGVSIQRTTSSKADMDNRNPTPYASFIKETERMLNRADLIARNPKMTNAQLVQLKDLVQEHVTSETALRSGDTAKAAEGRLARNEDRAQAMKKQRETGEEGEVAAYDKTDDIDAEQRSMAQRLDTGDGEQQSSSLVPRAMRAVPPTGVTRRGNLVRAPRDGQHTSEVNDAYGMPTAVWDGINAHKSVTLDTLLDKYKPDTKAKGQDAVVEQRFLGIIKALRDRVGNMKVVVVPDEVLAHYDPDANGMYLAPKAEQFVQGHNGTMVIAQSSANYYALAHEAVHGVTHWALHNDPSFARDIRNLMRDVKGADKMYGMLDEHEFVSEAMSNAEFQEVLQNTPLSGRNAGRWSGIANAWTAFVDRVSNLLGFKGKNQRNVLDAAMRAFDEAGQRTEAMREQFRGEVTDMYAPSPLIREAMESQRRYWESRVPDKGEWRLRTQRMFDKIATVTQLGNTSDHLFDPSRPARTLTELMGRMASEKDKIVNADTPLVLDLFKASRAYEASGQWRAFEDFLIDETTAGVYADRPLKNQKHLGKDSMDSWQPRAKHAGLASRYEALPQPLKDLRGRLHEYFRARQEEQSMGLIRNILKVMSPDGKGSEKLARRIYERKLTDADKEVLGGDAAMATLMKATKLAQIAGPYVPLMRRGDFVVQGHHKLPDAPGAVRMDESETLTPTGNVYEFKTRREAQQFVRGLDLPAEVAKVYVDPTTGSRKVRDEDGKERVLTSVETNADDRWRVTVNDKHVEFVDTLSAAKARRAELVAAGMERIADVDLRRMNAADFGLNFIPRQIQDMLNALEKRSSFKELTSAAQNDMRRHIQEMGIAAMATTRAQTRRLPRTNVRGANSDITTNTQQYSSSTAGYLARLRYQPGIDALMKAMTKWVDDHKYEGNTNDVQVSRRQRLREFERRIYDTQEPQAHTFFQRAIGRLLQISYLDKLASPAYHIINSMEPWTVSLPVIAARHGLGQTLAAMQRAYADIGAGTMIGQGVRDTGRAARSNDPLTDYTQGMITRLGKTADGADVAKVLTHMSDIGLMSRDAGMELGRIVTPEGGVVGRALDRADLMARQAGTAIEAINRSVTAIASYRLARAKGLEHDAALAQSVETVHDTMGDYNSWNAAPIFNHPLGRLVLQFRKYAQKTYYLLGKQAMAAFKGDKEAMKAFAGLMGTHMLVAGSLGLPLEVIKVAMLGAGLLGVTDDKYGDLEQGTRSLAASVLGKDGGEIFTRGLPRWLGLDLSARMGLDSLLLSNMDPKSMKSDDLYAYMARTFAGAPASYIVDAVQGFQALSEGKVLEATRLIAPLKIYADTVQAYQLATEGKKSPTGRQQVEPIRWDQAFVKSLGFQPGALAESQEQSFALRGDIARQKADRGQLVSDWVMASQSDKAAQWANIQRWNANQPISARVTYAELVKAMQSRQKESQKADYKRGVRTTARDRHLRGQNDFYNVP